ncbi:hypothetical protein ACNF49_39875 [Actinomadura sp. ATCC 39365]
MRPLKCSVIAAAVLAAPLLAPPAAHAEGSYECFFGSITPGQYGYHLSGNPCDGTGYADVVITVRSGSAAGTHRCATAFSWNGFLGADGCRKEPG